MGFIMSELSISHLIQKRLNDLDEAIKAWNKTPNALIRDAVILRLQRALSEVLALMHAAVSEEEECECESLEELIDSVRESELIDENEEEALLDIIRAVETISEAQDDEAINDIMQYLPLYHKALGIFAKKFELEQE